MPILPRDFERVCVEVEDLKARLAKLEANPATGGNTAALIQRLEKRMDELVKKIDEATNKVAERVKGLEARLSELGVAGDPKIKEDLQAILERLTGLGKDPENPVPDEEAK